MARPFPGGFLLGTATAATQIEGGCTSTDWARFAAEPGRIKGGDTPRVACAHWERWRDDVTLQAELGMRAHRFSLEWARIEPREGEIDRAALERYREEAALLVEHGITPMITLHHFSLPLWLAERGGLLHEDAPRLLERYARVVAEHLCDVCRLWITVNEPNVLVVMGYVFGQWPPAHVARLDEAVLASHRLLEAHTRMYRALHDVCGARGHTPHVGVAHHLRVVEPRDPARRRDQAAAKLMDGFFHEGFAGVLARGRFFGRPLDDVIARATGFHVREAQGTQDFFGLNYYTRDLVRFSPLRAREGFFERAVAPGSETSMLGWEVYPRGLTELLVKWHRRTKLPCFVTENGIATLDDRQRCRFLWRHLGALLDAADQGACVRGYLHWSLVDNFEWHEGYAPRFGLVEVDYRTQARRLRESARLLADIISEHALDDGVLARHLDVAEAA